MGAPQFHRGDDDREPTRLTNIRRSETRASRLVSDARLDRRPQSTATMTLDALMTA